MPLVMTARLGTRKALKKAAEKLADKNRLKLLKRIESLVARAKALSGVEIPDSLTKDIEKTINEEGHMADIIKRRFLAESEHGPGSRRWRALAPITVARRGSAHPILRVTGILRSGAMAATEGTFRMDNTRFDVDDVDVEYAAAHQFGTDRLPARPFFSDPTKKEMQSTFDRVRELIRAYLRREIAKLPKKVIEAEDE